MLKWLQEGADGHPSPPLPMQLDEEDADKRVPGREINAPQKIWLENMMEIITVIVKLTSKCRIKLFFLQKFNFDLEKALAAQASLLMGCRSEFQKGKLLLPLLKNHALWN